MQPWPRRCCDACVGSRAFVHPSSNSNPAGNGTRIENFAQMMQRPDHFAQRLAAKPPGKQDGPHEGGDSSAVGHHGQQHPDHEEADDGAGDHPRDQGAHFKHSREVP